MCNETEDAVVIVCIGPHFNPCPMEPLTKQDLLQLHQELLTNILKTLQRYLGNKQTSRKWIKTYEVVKLLNMSRGKLQTLRKNGTLKYTRFGSMIYYDIDDINALLEQNRCK